MEFDATTFALEVVNFLILIWILQRFLYKPVTRVIAERKAAVEEILLRARVTEEEARDLKLQYENRLTEWGLEKARARDELLRELEAERERQLVALRQAMDQERASLRAIDQKRNLEVQRGLEEKSRADAVGFAARLLSRMACPELEQRIGALVLADLPELPESQRQRLRSALLVEKSGRVNVLSAYPLGEKLASGLARALSELAGERVECDFAQTPDLMAGLRIGLGPWILHANLRDELRFFYGVSADA